MSGYITFTMYLEKPERLIIETEGVFGTVMSNHKVKEGHLKKISGNRQSINNL